MGTSNNPVIGTVVSTGVSQTGEPFVNIKLHGPGHPAVPDHLSSDRPLPARPPQPPVSVQARIPPNPSARQRAREAWGVEPQLLTSHPRSTHEPLNRPTGVPS